MSDQEAKPAYRLAGICKKCHRLGFGYLLYGVMGRFICYRCAQQQAESTKSTGPIHVSGPPTISFTGTTSNSSSNSTSNTDYTGSNSKK